MDNENHKKTWEKGFTKFVLWGSVSIILILNFNGNISIVKFKMIIGSISENKNLKKNCNYPRYIKKYKSLGLEVSFN